MLLPIGPPWSCLIGRLFGAAASRGSGAWLIGSALCDSRACRPGRGRPSRRHLEAVVKDRREHEANEEGDVTDLRIVVGYRPGVDGVDVREQVDRYRQADRHRHDTLPALVFGVIKERFVAVL